MAVEGTIPWRGPGVERGKAPVGSGVDVTLTELLKLRPVAARLAVAHADAVTGLLPGLYRSLFRGRGLDFEEVRAYQRGDDFRLLDWRVTARTGRLHTKVFQEEREHTLFLCIDTGPTMHFGTRTALKWVAAARAAAVVAWLAADNGDRVGGMVFGNGGRCAIERPRGGPSGAIRLFRLLARASSVQASAPHAGLADALGRLRHLVTPGGLIMLFTDFRGLDLRAQEHLSYLARHHDLAGLFVYDPLERELPAPGRYPFSDGSRRLIVDTGDRAIRQAFRRRFDAHRLALRATGRRYRIRLAELATDQPLIDALRPGVFRLPAACDRPQPDGPGRA